MTLSTIGYGDVVPVTMTETGLTVVCMLVGASLWAFVVGNVCGIIANLDVEGVQFRNGMDELNFFVEDNKLPTDLKIELREYFHESRQMQHMVNQFSLYEQMSPVLRANISYAANEHWIKKVRDHDTNSITTVIAATNATIHGHYLRHHPCCQLRRIFTVLWRRKVGVSLTCAQHAPLTRSTPPHVDSRSSRVLVPHPPFALLAGPLPLTAQ